MSIYAISDLHLPLGIHKPMDVFGESWENYVERIQENWLSTVKETDSVIMPGDFSWATYLEQSYEDFAFLNRLPGKKYLSKGNHDYWWTTASKLNTFIKESGFENIAFLHNNAFMCENIAVCASRGWISPGDAQFKEGDNKIYQRELIRTELSIQSGKQLGAEKMICALHYPPGEGFLDLLDQYEVDFCVYGHLHGKRAWDGRPRGERLQLVSADFLAFAPMKIELISK